MPGLAAKSVDETRRRNEFSSNKPGLDNKHDQDAGGATDLLAQPYRRPGLRAGALVLLAEQRGRRRLCGYLVVGEPRQQRARIPRPFASMAVCGSDLPARDQAASRELPGHTNIVLAARKSAVLARRRVRRRTQGRRAAARDDSMTTSSSQADLLEHSVFKTELASTKTIGGGARKPRTAQAWGMVVWVKRACKNHFCPSFSLDLDQAVRAKWHRAPKNSTPGPCCRHVA